MKFLILVILTLTNFTTMAKCKARWAQSEYNFSLDHLTSTQQIPLEIISNSLKDQCSQFYIKSENRSQRKLILEQSQINFDISFDSASASPFLPSGELYLVKPSHRQSRFLFNIFTHMQIAKNHFLNAGLYKHSERVYLYNQERQLLDIVIINYTTQIPSEMDIELLVHGTNTKISKAIQFKSLNKGERVDLDIKVTSNIGYSIWLESSNSGNLSHEGLGENIKYSLHANGTEVSTSRSSSSSIYQKKSMSSLIGDRIHLNFQVNQDLENFPSGEYSDVIHLNIQSEL